MPNITYTNQHIGIEIPLLSRDHVIVLGTVNLTFNLDIESTGKARSIFNKVGILFVTSWQVL